MCASGQFGTRLQGGKDAAGARYIMTRLDKIARVVFHEHDDKLLDYLKEEGQSIEPQWCRPSSPRYRSQDSLDTYCALLYASMHERSQLTSSSAKSTAQRLRCMLLNPKQLCLASKRHRSPLHTLQIKAECFRHPVLMQFST